MTSLVETLTASGGSEKAGFLNDIVEQLWPNIAVAGANILKDVVEPILASTLPGPLANLRFVKLDLGHIPLRLDNVDVHKTTNQGIKLDMDVTWESICDIELDGARVPKIVNAVLPDNVLAATDEITQGIERAHLKGRLSVLLSPLTNILPLIGAAQIAFINPPTLKLDFTDAANIADCFLIEKTVRNTILGIIESMVVLPNRFLVKLDANNDYFKTYQPHLGVLRLTIGKAIGIAAPKKTGASRLLQKIIKDVPDCYVKVKVGAEQEWRTSVQKNNHNPEWNETHDFLVTDYEQSIFVDVQDDDLVGDDDIGLAHTTIKETLLNGGSHELALLHQGEATESKLAIHAKFFHLVPDVQSLSIANDEGRSNDEICGLVTILIASALGLSGDRNELTPSVQITWGDHKFATVTKSYTPGVDIFNPSFDQAFKVPLVAEMLKDPATFKISLLNKGVEAGTIELPFQDVLSSPAMTKADSFDVGSGAVVRASISICGVQLAE